MSLTKNSGYISKFTILSTVLGLFALCFWFSADLNTAQAKVSKTTPNNIGSGTFQGTGTGNIPDEGGDENPLLVRFEVSGLTGSIMDIRLNTNLTHTYVADLDIVLIAPDQDIQAPVFLFTNPGGTGAGDSSNLSGAYNFYDAAPGSWWTAAGAVGGDSIIPPGDYKPSDNTGAAFSFNNTFAPTSPNGTWFLFVGDYGEGDVGSVNSASLTITTDGGGDGDNDANVDFNGDGISDYTITRDDSAGGSDSFSKAGSEFFKARSGRERMRIAKEMSKTLDSDSDSDSLAPSNHGTSLTWYIHNGVNNTDRIVGFGNPTSDFLVPEDYDGDGNDDIAVWRPVSNTDTIRAVFYILNSTDNTIRESDFGQPNDNPAVVGDYDGDGTADEAVFRCPAAGGQCFYYFRGSAGNGGITFVPWGNGNSSNLFPNIGDFDGDGKYDFNLFRTNPNTAQNGQFMLFRSSDQAVQFVNFGLNTDIIVPGDYDGDGRNDYALTRPSDDGNSKRWYVLSSTGTLLTYNFQFGFSDDVATPGDYDGDGKTDISIWRPQDTSGDSIFYTFGSGTSTVSAFKYGLPNDVPAANFQVQ